MTDDEKIQCAKDNKDVTLQKQLFAERRSSELADEFTKLEVQVATILFAFLGLFLDSFIKGLSGYSHFGVVIMKEVTFEQAKAFHEGSAQGDLVSVSVSPRWTWVMQTICLGISIIILFVIFLIALFH